MLKYQTLASTLQNQKDWYETTAPHISNRHETWHPLVCGTNRPTWHKNISTATSWPAFCSPLQFHTGCSMTIWKWDPVLHAAMVTAAIILWQWIMPTPVNLSICRIHSHTIYSTSIHILYTITCKYYLLVADIVASHVVQQSVENSKAYSACLCNKG